MSKTLEKVTKDPKRQERPKKSHEDIQEEAKRKNTRRQPTAYPFSYR